MIQICIDRLKKTANDSDGPFSTLRGKDDTVWEMCTKPWRGCFPRQPLLSTILLEVIGYNAEGASSHQIDANSLPTKTFNRSIIPLPSVGLLYKHQVYDPSSTNDLEHKMPRTQSSQAQVDHGRSAISEPVAPSGAISLWIGDRSDFSRKARKQKESQDLKAATHSDVL